MPPPTKQDVATLARVAAGLHANGQRTTASQFSVERVAEGLGRPTASTEFSWAGATIDFNRSQPGHLLVPARPAGLNMRQVVTVSHAVDAFSSGAINREELDRTLEEAAASTPWSTGAFAGAAVAGAVALAVIFGAHDPWTLLLVAVAAGSGALLRRAAGRFKVTTIGQSALAALVAGLVGGSAVRYELAPGPDLVALCACMILVPGPHILNAGLDSISARLDLALARLGYAATLLVAIGVGLLVGMAVWGVSLPPSATSSASVAPWWEVPAAGVAGYAYSTFFNTPGRLMGWPVAVAALSHTVHWTALHAGASLIVATLLACLVAGSVLAPIAHRRHLPFAPLAFASVVSMIPGVYVFHALSGLSQLATSAINQTQLAVDVAQDAATASALLLAIVLGVALPVSITDRRLVAWNRPRRSA